ncbi:MAG: response regulator [Lentisphaeria bacterium]|nr:response regulator [Lentisphaeria bacterium]NQZ70401.1 response regulator [Lentisphaeria bacterium]
MKNRKVFLLPGELTFQRLPTEVTTILGSCVAVCIYDKKKHWGGMNHYMLASADARHSMEQNKMGVFAINNLLKIAQKSGCSFSDLEASIYGGAKVLKSQGNTIQSDIGGQNILIAKDILAKHNIQIMRNETGGQAGRRICMNTHTNEIKHEVFDKDKTKAKHDKLQDLNAKNKIKVLIVDDSQVVRNLINEAICTDPSIEVTGMAANPYETRELIAKDLPDVICLDIIMPKMDGCTFLKKIMKYKPIPTIIISTIAQEGSEMYNKVLAAGAVGVLDKEKLEIYKGISKASSVIIPQIKRASKKVF